MRHKKQPQDKQRSQELRGLIREEAARLMVEDDIRDFLHAKRKAAATYQSHNQSEWPSNEEVEAARQTRLSIFRPAGFDHVKQDKLRCARRGMRLLDAYQPRLTGQLVYGGITENSPIEIHLFADTVEDVILTLQDQLVQVELTEKTFRYPKNLYIDIPLLVTEIDDNEVLLSVFPPAHIRQKPLSPIDGLPMKRRSLGQLEQGTWGSSDSVANQ